MIGSWIRKASYPPVYCCPPVFIPASVSEWWVTVRRKKVANIPFSGDTQLFFAVLVYPGYL